MLSIQQLAQTISQELVNANPLSFQRFLTNQNIFMNPNIVKVLSDIMAAPGFDKNQKILAGSGFNLIFIKRINQNYEQQTKKCWNQFFAFLIDRSTDDLIEWQYLTLTLNALIYLISQIPEHPEFQSIEKFNSTLFTGKLMLMRAVNQCQQLSETNKFKFIRETIETFIQESYNLFTNIQNQSVLQYQYLVLEHDAIIELYEWLDYVTVGQIKSLEIQHDFLYILAKNSSNLTALLKEVLRWSLQIQNGVMKHKNSSDLLVLYDQSMIDNIKVQGVAKALKFQVSIKAAVLSIIPILVNQFQFNSNIEKFDTIPILNLFQKLTPILIQELCQNQLLKQYYLKQLEYFDGVNFKDLLMAIFSVLRRSAQFIFLFGDLNQRKQQILYNIFYYYLRTTNSEKQRYESESQEFYRQNEVFVEQTEKQDADFSTPKQLCGQFLKEYFALINQSKVEYIEFLAACLRYQILSDHSHILLLAKEKDRPIPSVETIYSIITKIYFFADKKNQYFVNFVYKQFIEPEFLVNFKGIQKFRVLFMLQYVWGQYFDKNSQNGNHLIIWAVQTKSSNQAELLAFHGLLRQVFGLGAIADIWVYLMDEVSKSYRREGFQLILFLLQNHLNKIASYQILDLVARISARMQNRFQKNKQNYSYENFNDDILYLCFHIVQQIAEDNELAKNTSILGEILGIVDFFAHEGLEKYNFCTEVIKLLNQIVLLQDFIPIEFQMYLGIMNAIVEENQKFDCLLETYYLLLLKGNQTFKQHPEFLHRIQFSIEQKILNPKIRNSVIIIESIFLLQNIYMVYSEIIKENREVFKVTQKIFQEENRNLQKNQKISASILLYWMAGEYAFGNYALDKLIQCKISMFTNEFSLMFALNVRKLIQKYYQTESLDQLLRLLIKILDWELFYKNQKKYRSPSFCLSVFKKYVKVDPFQQSALAFNFIKERLPPQKYANLIQILRKEIGNEELKRLLTMRILDYKKQRCIVTVKRVSQLSSD